MSRSAAAAGAALAILASAAAEPYLPLRGGPPGITDLALIYQGAAFRPVWTAERLAPYVTFVDPKDGRERWLFDGFLLLDLSDGRGHAYTTGVPEPPATKDDWARLLDAHFAPGAGIPTLDELCARAATRIGEPRRRRRVVLGLPTPLAGFSGWGEIDGRALDFAKPEDRIAACSWHLHAAVARWKALAPRRLDLAGFYWIAEAADGDREILPRVARIVHELGLSFVWIPYWKATGAGDWRALGFDAAWQQPNAFFHPDVPLTRVDEACAFARSHGMGLEMELDGRLLSAPEVFGPRFDAYLDAFARRRVARASSIAYYEGGGAFLALGEASDPGAAARSLRLRRFVAARQRRAKASGDSAARGLSSARHPAGEDR